MKTKMTLLVFLLAKSVFVFSQSEYYNALALENGSITIGNTLVVANNDQNLRILSKYLTNSTLSCGDIVNEFQSNPFFQVAGCPMAATSISNIASSAFSSVGGLNVTTFADGLSKFIVERAKEEINIAFFDRFREVPNNYPEFKVLFPQTFGVLDKIDSYEYSGMIDILKSAFEKDLNNLSGNIVMLREIDTAAYRKADKDHQAACQKRIKFYKEINNRDTGQILYGTAIIIDKILKGYNAADIIDTLAKDPIAHNDTSNISNTIMLFSLISDALRSDSSNKIWVSASDLGKLISDKNAFQIFLGLVYQRNKSLNIQFYSKSIVRLQDYLGAIASDFTKYDQIKSYFMNVVNSAGSLETKLKGIKDLKTSGQTLTFENYFQYFSSTVNLLSSISQINQLNVLQLPQFTFNVNPKVTEYLNIASSAGQIYYDIKTRNFSSAVFEVYSLLDTTLCSHFVYDKEFLKYGAFMASVVQAKNSDDVKAAIEAVALPAGSYSIKRLTCSNISLNSYLGLAGSYEFATNSNTSTNHWAWGFFAPVGPCFSWGMGKGWSFSTLISAIDLGAITSYRFNDTTTAALPDFTLQNILAPGLDFIFGVPKAPISFGIGGQLGPQLRKITTETATIDQSFWRIQAFFAVDIPLINFHTTPKISSSK